MNACYWHSCPLAILASFYSHLEFTQNTGYTHAKKLVCVEYADAAKAHAEGLPIYLTSKEQPLPEDWVPLLHTILGGYGGHTLVEEIQAFVSTKIISGKKSEVLYWIDDPEQS